MEAEEEVRLVSTARPAPRPHPKDGPPPLRQGLQVLSRESRMWARERARLGGEFVCVGFYPLISKRI